MKKYTYAAHTQGINGQVTVILPRRAMGGIGMMVMKMVMMMKMAMMMMMMMMIDD
jgi:hypothetical protein